MAQIDLLLAAELVVALLLVATLDCPRADPPVPEPELDGPTPPVRWAAETDLHAQRILRLERRRIDGATPPLT